MTTIGSNQPPATLATVNYASGNNVSGQPNDNDKAVQEVADKYQQLVKAQEALAANTVPERAKTLLNNVRAAFMVFKAAVKKNEQALPEDALVFYNNVIASFAVDNPEENKSTSSNYIDIYKDLKTRNELRKEALIRVTELSKRLDQLRTRIAALTKAYGDKGGTRVEFSELLDEIESILLEFGGTPGLDEGKGVLGTFSGDEAGLKDAKKWAADEIGPAASKEIKLVDGKYVVTLDLSLLRETQTLFVEMNATQEQNGGALSSQEFGSMESAIRGKYGSFEGKVTTASQLVSQLQQMLDTTVKQLSTLMSNEADEVSKMYSRI